MFRRRQVFSLAGLAIGTEFAKTETAVCPFEFLTARSNRNTKKTREEKPSA
jgi:hypothetical protein